jgi:hypothetical protein
MMADLTMIRTTTMSMKRLQDEELRLHTNEPKEEI